MHAPLTTITRSRRVVWQFWAARPLESNDAAFKYAAFSVGLLFDLEDALAKDMGDPRGFDFVARYSRQRVEEYKMPAAAPRSRCVRCIPVREHYGTLATVPYY